MKYEVPTYPNEIKFSDIGKVYGMLIREKEYHREHSLFYYRLFNEQVPLTSLDKVKIVYTPLQEFYQLQAQYHAVKHFASERKVNEFAALMDKIILE